MRSIARPRGLPVRFSRAAAPSPARLRYAGEEQERLSPSHLPVGRAVGIVLKLDSFREQLVADAIGFLEIACFPSRETCGDRVSDFRNLDRGLLLDALGDRRKTQERQSAGELLRGRLV